MATLLSVTNSASSGNSIGNPAGTYFRQSQSFTAGNWQVTGVTLQLLRGGGTADVPLTIRIETDSSNKPSGTLAHANATAQITSFTEGTFQTKAVTYTAFTLTDGNKYHIVIRTAETEASGNFYRDKYNGTENPYSGGGHNTATSGTWGTEAIYDNEFLISGTDFDAVGSLFYSQI